MPESKKCFLDYSTDNEIVGLRLVVGNNKDNDVSFFTKNEKEETTVFASLFLPAAEVKNSALVVRDKKAGLDFFLANGDKLFIGFFQAPELGLDPDDEDDPDKIRAKPTPKPKPFHSFLILSLIPSAESKTQGALSLPKIIVRRDALAQDGSRPTVVGPLETAAKDDAKKTFAWGEVADSNRRKTVVFCWATHEEAAGKLSFDEPRDSDPICLPSVVYAKDKTCQNESAEIFAFGLFDDEKTALSNATKTIDRLSKAKVPPLKSEKK